MGVLRNTITQIVGTTINAHQGAPSTPRRYIFILQTKTERGKKVLYHFTPHTPAGFFVLWHKQNEQINRIKEQSNNINRTNEQTQPESERHIFKHVSFAT